MRFGVGGGKGLSDFATAADELPYRSALLSDVPLLFTVGASTVMDLMNVT